MPNLRVLLVDDEEELVSALRERLELRNIDAEYALNGAQAISLVKDRKFDVAIIDVMMPEMNGLEVLAKMKQFCPALKVILLTGRGDEKESRESRRIGASDYIIKPVNIDTLIEKMKKAVGETNE